MNQHLYRAYARYDADDGIFWDDGIFQQPFIFVFVCSVALVHLILSLASVLPS